MRKVLVISATPRREGNSDILADRVADGARAAGAEVEKVRLADRKIGYCRACDSCQKSRETLCVQQDGMSDLYLKILQADAIVLASPIYFFTISGQLKVFLDRTYALGGGGDWTALAGKKAAAVFTYAEPNALYSGVTNAFRMLQDACSFLGVELVGCVHAPCAAPGEIRGNAAALKAAEELGHELAKG